MDSSSDTISVSNSSDSSTTRRKKRGAAEKKKEASKEKKFGKKITTAGRKVVKALEIFCGCARLTAELREAGFDAIGVDHMSNKDKPEARSVLIDASSRWGQREIKRRALECGYVPIAPPCGTASKARDRRLKGKLDPKPLRSDAEPEGLSTLEGKDLKRVLTANELYRFIAELVELLDSKGIAWSVENPRNSYMWKTRWFRRLFKNPNFHYRWMHAQMCMHGGKRDKWTSLLHGGPINLVGLSKVCDGNHTHAPWGLLRTANGGFATAEERNYPRLFCKRIAAQAAKDLGVTKALPSEKPVQHRIEAELQPRRNHNDIVPEFKDIKMFGGATEKELEFFKSKNGEARSSANLKNLGNLVVPANSKTLNVTEEEGSTGLSAGEVGIQWSKSEFVKMATQKKHPFDEEIKVPQRIAQAIYNIAKLGPDGVAKKRRLALKYYSDLKRELSVNEANLHKSMHEDVERIAGNKNILLFEQMLRDVGYDDMAVCDLLKYGVFIIGDLDKIGIWKESDEKESRCSAEQLWALSKEAQDEVLVPRTIKNRAVEDSVWKTTLEEVKDKLLDGPFTREQIADMVGEEWIAARRFGLEQGDKIRPIDNFAQFMVNNAFGSKEKVQLLGVDHVIAWSRAWLGAYKDDGGFDLVDSLGEKWCGRINKDWTKEEWRKIRGRITDLSNAYKQVPVNPRDKALSIIAVQDPDSMTVKLFRAMSLMFGETSAVYAFLRISRALSTLATRLFDLVVVEFFDDFTQLEADKSSTSAWAAMEGLMKLLGWEVSMKKNKRYPFMKAFVSLGVKIDFKYADEEIVVICNKEGRLEAIESVVKEVLKKSKMGFKEALSIKGKIAYAEGQFYGRVAAQACRMLSLWARDGDEKWLTLEMEMCLKNLMGTLWIAGPRIVKMVRNSLPIVIFTDGACEDGRTSIGGIIFVQGEAPEAFGAVMSDWVIKEWATKMDQVQVIGQAEIFPVLVARLTWEKKLAGNRVLYFIDNDSARLALIKSYSPVLPSLRIICECTAWDCKFQSVPWYARVSTHANAGDGPSRMDKTEVVKEFGARIVNPVFPIGNKWSSDVLG